ncbi:thioredoxin 1 [Sporothrix schenckii 1099-18]|uniref:Thioredoxin domain-containing protein n=2 Tax=Sporothrix schenckii TaxID=29908 RepID=U7PJD7_SPOS1|nr:thioredoxin 1 [Sporothrix schenckii 1099-18]ERS94849.1 hypothetical protein HMPREF1624_08746 [Sporothrix schenckii ATCC 58251]KJR89004.1 thioredoxin 1 [Sporothrix schenckii 1099-18]
MTTQIAELADLTAYEAELAKPGVVVLDFYSTQCPPCKVIAPHYEKLAAKASNAKFRFFKINGLVEPGTTVQKAAQVVWWPTLVVYENGKETWRERVPNPPTLEAIKNLDDVLNRLSGLGQNE